MIDRGIERDTETVNSLVEEIDKLCHDQPRYVVMYALAVMVAKGIRIRDTNTTVEECFAMFRETIEDVLAQQGATHQ